MDDRQAVQQLDPRYAKLLGQCYYSAFKKHQTPDPNDPLNSFFEGEGNKTHVLIMKRLVLGPILCYPIIRKLTKGGWILMTLREKARITARVGIPYLIANICLSRMQNTNEILPRLGFKYEKQLRAQFPDLSKFPPSWESKFS